MSTFSVTEAAERFFKKEKKIQREMESRRVKAQAFARDLAQKLGESDGSLVQVVGFGSTFETWRHYREDSDIDLGLIGGDWNKLMEILPICEFEVSLITLAHQSGQFKEQVQKNGVVLYEKC